MRIHHKNPPAADVAVGDAAAQAAQPATESAADEQYRPINKFRAMLLRIWGPADGWDNPLVGTKYDPGLRAQRQHDSLEERRERWEHRKEHWDEVRHHHHDRGDQP